MYKLMFVIFALILILGCAEESSDSENMAVSSDAEVFYYGVGDSHCNGANSRIIYATIREYNSYEAESYFPLEPFIVEEYKCYYDEGKVVRVEYYHYCKNGDRNYCDTKGYLKNIRLYEWLSDELIVKNYSNVESIGNNFSDVGEKVARGEIIVEGDYVYVYIGKQVYKF